MPNKNYEKGRRKEYSICEKLKKENWDIVQRTAGSNSPFDIIAINFQTKVIKFIQSKPDSMSDKEKEKIQIKNNNLNRIFRTEFEVI